MRQAGASYRLGDRPLDRGFMEMEPCGPAPTRIPADPPGREHELPWPRSIRARVFGRQCAGHADAAVSAPQVIVMQSSYAFELADERGRDRRREHGDAILAALPLSYRDLARLEVQVFHA